MLRSEQSGNRNNVCRRELSAGTDLVSRVNLSKLDDFVGTGSTSLQFVLTSALQFCLKK